MLHTPDVLNSTFTKLMSGYYVAVCIYQFPLLIPDKNKYMGSDQTYYCPHNSYINSLQRRRIWLFYNTTTILFQLNGIHITHSKSSKMDTIVWQLFQADRGV